MPGGRVDHVPVRLLDLAANTLVFSAAQFKALLIIAAVPELLRIMAFFANDAVARSTGWWLPNWLMNLVSYGISALVFTGIIRYVVLGEGPSWFPGRQLIRNYLTTAAVLVVAASIIALMTGSYLVISFYTAFIAETPYDESKFLETYAIYSALGFFLSAALIAAIYPIFGTTAVCGQFGAWHLLRWGRKYFWRFFVLALLLMSVCLVLQRAYWWLLKSLAPDLTTAAYYVEHENVRSLVEQITEVPMDIVFDVVPAVAVGLLYRILRADSADL